MHTRAHCPDQGAGQGRQVAHCLPGQPSRQTWLTRQQGDSSARAANATASQVRPGLPSAVRASCPGASKHALHGAHGGRQRDRQKAEGRAEGRGAGVGSSRRRRRHSPLLHGRLALLQRLLGGGHLLLPGSQLLQPEDNGGRGRDVGRGRRGRGKLQWADQRAPGSPVPQQRLQGRKRLLHILHLASAGQAPALVGALRPLQTLWGIPTTCDAARVSRELRPGLAGRPLRLPAHKEAQQAPHDAPLALCGLRSPP